MSTTNSRSEASYSKTADELLIIKRMKDVRQLSAAVTAELGEYENLYAKMQRFRAPSEVCIS